MKSTNTELIYFWTFEREGEKYHSLRLRFDLHEEDMELAEKVLSWMNERNEGTEAPQMDLADFFLSCITRQIHALTEERTGKPFVLRMDRKPN